MDKDDDTFTETELIAVRALGKPILALTALVVVLMFSSGMVQHYFLFKKAEVESKTVNSKTEQLIKDLTRKIERLEETSNKAIGNKSTDTGFFKGSGAGSLPEVSPSDKN